MSGGTDGDRPDGTVHLRRRIRPSNFKVGPPVPHAPRTVRFTPPCPCGYPMLKGETACLRCGRGRGL